MLIVSLGYLIDSFGGFFWKGYDAELTRYTFADEVLLMGWLLWKARRLQQSPLSGGRSATAVALAERGR